MTIAHHHRTRLSPELALLAGSREPLGPSLSGVLYPMDSTNPAICVLPDRPASVMTHHSHNGSTPFHGYRGLSALVPLSLADSEGGSQLVIVQSTLCALHGGSVPDVREHESISIGTLKDLEVWQKLLHLAKDSYELTRS